MADYYLQFSAVLSNLNGEEADWLKQQLKIVHVCGDQEFTPDKVPPGSEPGQVEWTGYRFRRTYEDDLVDPEDLGFNFAFSKEDEPDLGRNLWIYALEHGELAPLAHLVQMFLLRFRPDECWYITYASTCSIPRPDSFGGGAVFVTAAEIKYNDTWEFVDRERTLFAASRAATAALSD